MISKELVRKLVDQWLDDKEYFLTDLTVSADNRIVVEIDQEEGVWIEDCVNLSRFVENGLDRDEEDFELEVGSAGIGQPFKVRRQYEIHIGDDVDETGFTVVTEEKVKHEGEKRPHIEEVEHRLDFRSVKWTRLHINFK